MKLIHAILLTFLLVIIFLLSGCTSSPTDLSNIIKNPNSYINEIINVKGTANADVLVKCTLQMCSKEDPCCQTCSSNLLLTSKNSSVIIKGGECKGNNCEMSCSPLKKDKEYLVKGLFEKKGTKYYLQPENFEELN